MAHLHYGAELSLELDTETLRRAVDAIGGHATRGGWVTVADVHGKPWTILVTPGVPIWVDTDDEAVLPPD